MSTKFKFEDDFMFAKPVKSAYLESVDREVFWLNGKSEEHNAFTKLVGDDKTRQHGWEKAVYGLACNEDGTPRYKGKVGISEWHASCDKTFARDYGMLILGISKGDKKNDFEESVEEELGNSGKAKGDSIN